jgi:hypothetical protein
MPIAVQPRQGISMKLFVQTTIVFFGTLLAAALVALGQPASAEVQMAQPDVMLVSLLGLSE